MISFASDNNAGVHPKIMDALYQANIGHCPAYGNDSITDEAIELFKHTFGQDVDVAFVFLGTAANVLGLKTMMQAYDGVICTDVAHINQDEGGAPERFTGKLFPVAHENGKLNVSKLSPFLAYVGNPHKVQPKVISITQATEYGTVYTIKELKSITRFAHEHGLYVHMDGARLANAAVALKCSLKAITTDIGIDVVSFGGTKNGMMYGEAVVFCNPELALNFPFIQKQGMQMASKMRYISVQFKALLSDSLWVENAQKANNMAKYFAEKLAECKSVKITQPVEVNCVFAQLPSTMIPALQAEFPFYVWNLETHEVRLMTSFDTDAKHIDAFVDRVQQLS
jgi:threonine aldolase